MCRARPGRARLARGAIAACAFALSLGATAAQAQLFLPLGSFGGTGSGSGQFQAPLGLAVDQASGDVYVADSGNARVQKFSGTGTFIAAWGYGVTDGTAVSQVCTTTCQAGIPGSGAGQFQTPSSVAVDRSGGPSNGDVYVGDSGNQVVLKFDTNGNFLATIDGTTSTQGHFSVVAGVAVDQSGNLWVADGNTDNIIEFDPNGNFVQQWNDTFGQTVAIAVDATNNAVYLIRGAATTERFTLTGGGETVIDNDASCTALSVDPASGNLFVDHGSFVNIFDPSGTMINTFTLSTSDSQGLAFGTSSGNVYVSDRTANNVTFYGPPTTPGPPLIFSESATNLNDTGATLNTTIVPFGLDTTCEFQYVDDATFQSTGYSTATTVPCVPSDLGSSFTFQNASATITGLTTLTTYHFRAVATNADGTVNGADKTFQTTGPAIVVTQPATNLTDTTATLNATVNPNGLDTTCVFQYVDDTDFQATGYTTATSVPCNPSDVGTGFTPVSVSADVSGLTPATTYHFRAVATSADGTVNGNDQTFTTLIAGPPTVSGEAASSVTDASATLNATVNPFGLDTTCTFQYVTDASLMATGYASATSVPCNPSDVGNSFSPQSVTAAITGLTPGTTYHFRAVAVNADGTTNGADTTFQTVVAFMVQVGTFGSAGAGSGQFQTPIGVAAAGGKVYVADSGNARVERFNQKGVFKGAWGWGVKDGQAKSEVCTGKSCQAGIPGAGAGQFSVPTSIAVDSSRSSSKGSVYVGDAGNNVVLKFKASGKFVSTIDGTTTPQGHFVSLGGVAVDGNGNVWTTDTGTGNVDRFDSSGNFVQQFPIPSGFGGLQGGIAVDSNHGGAVYLILNGNQSGTTVKFTLSGGSPTTIDPSGATALGLDPQSGNLFVDHGVPNNSGLGASASNIAVYGPSGAQIGTLPSLGGGTSNNSQGLAYFPKSKSGKQDRLYVGDASNDVVTLYGPRGVGAPFISAEATSHAGLTSMTLSAGIVPLGRDTTCTSQYIDSATWLTSGSMIPSNATSVPCSPADLGSSFVLQTGQALVAGLTVGGVYHFHVTATNSSGTVTGPDQTFQVGPGDWTPFFRCPVDDPAMLAADGSNLIPACIASNSTHGSITIGSITTPTGNTNLQFGILASNGTFGIVAPAGGSVISDPTPAAGGIIAIVSSAGDPSNFDLIAGLSVGAPIVTLPIKIQLTGAGLGPTCFIGTDLNPIVLHPANTSLAGASGTFATFDPDGTPDPIGTIGAIFITGAIQGDSTFSVPAASGCTDDNLVNALLGLPSPSGANNLVLLDASSNLALPNANQNGLQWSTDWHTGFGGSPPTSTTTTTTSTTTTTT